MSSCCAPQAAHANLNGGVAYAPRPGRGKRDFQFEVVRLWERPVGDLLAGDIGVLPLAPLGQLPGGVDLESGLAAVVQQMSERLLREAPPDQLRRLLTAAFVLTGLRVSSRLALQLFQGVQAMHESSTYQYILDQGAEREVKKLLVRSGKKPLGEPDEAVTTALAGITDLERLERMHDRLGEVKSWQDLLAVL